MDILKIIICGVLTAVLCSFMKQLRPELVPLTAFAGITVMAVFTVEKVIRLTDAAAEFISFSGIQNGNVEILLKCTVICAVTRIGADICNDNSCTAAGDVIELSGKISAVMIALPMIKSAAGAVIGLLE